MKTDKDIVIDGLMARIRELEQQISYSNKTNHLAKSTRSNVLFNGVYSEIDGLSDIFYDSIDILEMNIRTTNCLRAENVYYVGQLVSCTKSEILKTPHLGKKSVNDIVDILQSKGLSLGMSKQDKIDYSNN